MNNLHLHIELQQYGKNIILQSVNQRFEVGKIHGILGENGAGKTTLFQCMANMIPFKGEPMLKGIQYGYLPAELYMYPMITGNEFLQFYITAKGIKMDRNEIDRLNNLFELPLDAYADRYSTGMLKKLYILGLLLQHNELLLLDEPFNGLDFKSASFITVLIKYFRDSGGTVFVASHDIDHLFTYVDTLSVIENKNLTYYPKKDQFYEIKQKIEEEARDKINAVMKCV